MTQSTDLATSSCTLTTPVGQLRVAATPAGVTAVQFEGRWSGATTSEGAGDAMLREACAELVAYFVGTLRTFSVPCALEGTTFQQRVWGVLCTIPYGEVVSYRSVAERIGDSKAVRAVGTANGRNPVPIIVPCHRVIGSDGSLTGFGGGLPRKQWLLEHEGAASARLF